MSRLKKGDPAPEISLPAIDGSTFEMSSMKGQRVILTFFRFSSCPFCNIRNQPDNEEVGTSSRMTRSW